MPKGKVLKVGLASGLKNLHPRKALDVDGQFVLNQILEAPYVHRPDRRRAEPMLLAEPLRHEVSGGSSLYSARICEGIHFSNGELMTAHDVARAIATSSSLLRNVKIEVRGDQLSFELESSIADPEKLLLNNNSPVFQERGGVIIGTGPYKILSQTEDELILERNPHYRDPAIIDRIVFRTYPPNASGQPTELIAALSGGEVDFCNSLLRDDIVKLTGLSKFIEPGNSTAFLFLNTERPALGDVRVRRAIALAVDPLELARTCYKNPLAFSADSALPRRFKVQRDSAATDVGTGELLLLEEGVEAPSTLSLLVIWNPRPYLPNPRRVAETLAGQLAEIGIRLEIDHAESREDYFKRMPLGQHDLVLAGWIMENVYAADYLMSLLHSARIPSAELGLGDRSNLSRWQSSRMDSLLLDYTASSEEPILSEILDLIEDQVPLIPLMYGSTCTALSFKVENFKPSPFADLTQLSKLDLKT